MNTYYIGHSTRRVTKHPHLLMQIQAKHESRKNHGLSRIGTKPKLTTLTNTLTPRVRSATSSNGRHYAARRTRLALLQFLAFPLHTPTHIHSPNVHNGAAEHKAVVAVDSLLRSTSCAFGREQTRRMVNTCATCLSLQQWRGCGGDFRHCETFVVHVFVASQRRCLAVYFDRIILQPYLHID